MKQACAFSFRHTHAYLLEQLSDWLGDFFSDPDYQSHERPNESDKADELKSLTTLLNLLIVLLGKLFLHLFKLPLAFDTNVNKTLDTNVTPASVTNVTHNSLARSRHLLGNFSIFRQSNHLFTPSTAVFLWPFSLFPYLKRLLSSYPPRVKVFVNMRFYLA